MKLRTALTLLAMTSIALTSCDKDDVNLPFSELDPEANKQLVENSAIDAVKAFDELKDQPVVEASVNMGNLLEMSNPMDAQSGKKSKVTGTIEIIAGLSTDETSIGDIFASIASPGELTEDPESIQEAWEEVVGNYTWNSSMEEWDYTTNADAIVFKFPSTENGTANNATFTVSNYTGVTVSNPLEDEYAGDLPASLNIDFDVDGTSVLSMTFAAEYNDDGIPTSLASDLTIEMFKFAVDGTNNDKEVSANYSFTQDGAIIMEMKGSVKGDFTQENIDANTNTHSEIYTWTDYQYNEMTGTYDEVPMTETDTWEELDAEEVVHTGSFKFQLFNISIGGEGDIKAMGDAYDLIYPEDYYNTEGFDYKAAAEAEAAAMNEHLKMYAIDEDSRKKIADVEAYVVMENDYGYTDYWVDFRLVYGDGSYVDLETYFENGFDDVVNEINAMIDDLNTQYDLGLDHMEY